MPNEFAGLEKVTGKVSSVASKVKGWIESIQWEAPSQFGKDNPFKGIKNFEELNKKYIEIRSQQSETQLSLINMFYSSQREVIIKGLIELLRKIQAEYKIVNEKKKQLKMTDAPIKMTQEEFNAKIAPNLNKNVQQGIQPDPQVTQQPQQKQEETPQQKAVRERIKDIDNDLKQILITLGIYKQYSISDEYNNNKNDFINRLATSLNNSLMKQTKKTELYKQEFETGKILPKKDKTESNQQVKTKDSYLTAGKSIKLKIKSK